MMKPKRRFTLGEEIANSISHGLGVVFGIVALVILIVSDARRGTTGWQIVSYSIYGSSMILLYLSSTLNHSLRFGSKAKNFFHNFDQIAIYVYIAGTYTPLALVFIRGDWGWVMFGIEWGVAIAGIIVKVLIPNKFEKGVNTFYIIAYIVMGWLLLFFIIPLNKHLPGLSLGFIFIGGACYTLGTIFFKLKKLPYTHLIWHLFVIAGSVMHWLAFLIFTLRK